MQSYEVSFRQTMVVNHHHLSGDKEVVNKRFAFVIVPELILSELRKMEVR